MDSAMAGCRLLIVGGITIVAMLVVALALRPSSLPSVSDAAARMRLLCGSDRWTVKTLQDRPQLRPARATTVARLDRVRKPGRYPVTRLPFEHNVFTVKATVYSIHLEGDGDYHVLLSQGSAHLISEAPSGACTARADARLQHAMRVARSRVRVCALAKVTGVAFFDPIHGQDGVAPNGIELHPILGFHCLSG
jgi:hypothetical protein